MKKPLLFLLFFSITLTSSFAQLLDTVRIQATGLDGTVPISTDDAEQINNKIDKLYDDDLDAGWEGDDFNVVTFGLRFRGIKVPKGARIDSAFVEFFSHEDEGDPSRITIYAEASDSAVTYNETDLITARPKTTATIKWNVTGNWAIWSKQRSPELKTLIQEVVNRPGWKVGNALALVFAGEDQGASNQDNAREIEAFENVADPDDGGDGRNKPERIPKLYIYYSNTTSTKNIQVISDLKITPNPIIDGTFNVSVAPFKQENIMITLSDMSGKVICQWSQDNVNQDFVTLDVTAAPGLYTVEIRSTEKIGITKVIIH